MPDVAGVKFPYTPQGVKQAEQFASSLAQQYGTPAAQMGLGAPGYWRGGPFEMAPRLNNGGVLSEVTVDLDPAVFQEAIGPVPEIPAVGNEALSDAESINQQLKTAQDAIGTPPPAGTLPNYNAPVSVNGTTSEEAEAAAKKAKRREEWRKVGLDVAKNVGTTAVTELINKKKRRVALPTPPAGGLSAGKGLDLNTLLPQGTSLGNLPGYGMANGGQPPAPIPDMMSLPPFMAPLGGGGGPPPPGPPPPGPPPPAMQMGGVLGRKMFAEDGGALRGPGGPKQDLIPVWASNGEYMLSKDTVDRVGGGDHQEGVEILNRLNFGRK